MYAEQDHTRHVHGASAASLHGVGAASLHSSGQHPVQCRGTLYPHGWTPTNYREHELWWGSS